MEPTRLVGHTCALADVFASSTAPEVVLAYPRAACLMPLHLLPICARMHAPRGTLLRICHVIARLLAPQLLTFAALTLATDTFTP